jgi:periplasmic protein TonB
VDPGAPLRLLLAIALSCVLHLSLLYTVRVAPARPVAAPPLQARLQLPADPSLFSRDAQPARTVRERRTPRPTEARSDLQPAAAILPALQPPSNESSAPDAAPMPVSLPAVELPFLRDTTWYPARQLDVFPRPLTPLQPAYPDDADLRGEVTLLVLIDEAGAVHEVTVAESQLPERFQVAAAAAFRNARFEPALKDGRAVRSRVVVKVAFVPEPPTGATDASR